MCVNVNTYVLYSPLYKETSKYLNTKFRGLLYVPVKSYGIGGSGAVHIISHGNTSILIPAANLQIMHVLMLYGHVRQDTATARRLFPGASESVSVVCMHDGSDSTGPGSASLSWVSGGSFRGPFPDNDSSMHFMSFLQSSMFLRSQSL